MDNLDIEQDAIDQKAEEQRLQQEKQEQAIHYSWLKLKDYSTSQGLNHIFGVSESHFERWLKFRISKNFNY
jgi:hypothetical protein